MVRKSKKGKLSIDFSDTDSRKTVPEGDYTLEVVKVEEKEGQKAPYLSWEFKVAEGDYAGSKVWNNTSLSASALWNLRIHLEALGYDIPTGIFDLDINDLVGLQMGATLEHEKYDNKVKSKIVDVFPADEDDDDDSSDEEDDSSDEEDEEEDEEDDDSSDEDEDEDDDEESDDDEEEEEEPELTKKEKKAAKRKARRAARKGRGED